VFYISIKLQAWHVVINICYKSSNFPSSNGDKTKIKKTQKKNQGHVSLGRIHLTHGTPVDCVCLDGLVAKLIREGCDQKRAVSGSKTID
jgi:hypothetical protein